MVLTQVTFEIPSYIQTGIANGDFKIFNGIVRDSKGRIVHHLQEAVFNKNNNKSLVVAGIVVAATVTAVTGTLILNRLSKKKNSNSLVDDFNNSMVKYMVAVKDMMLDKKVVDDVYEDLEALKQVLTSSNKNAAIMEQMDMEKFNTIIDSVYELTIELAKNNNFGEVEIKRTTDKTIENSIVDLKEYLEIQKDMLQELE